MDLIDFKLLELLDENARASLSSIGGKLRLSKASVARRIEKLGREEIITGYYAVIDSYKLGYLSFRVYVKFNNASPKTEEAFLNDLVSDKRIWYVGTIQGAWDVGFVAWVKDLHEFKSLWLGILSKYRKHVGKYKISPYTSLTNYSLSFSPLSAPKKTAGMLGSPKKVSITAKDALILRVLASNASLPLTKIALQTGLTPIIVKYRLKSLLDSGVIQSFRVNVDMAKLGYSLYKVDFFLEDLKKTSEIRAFLESFPSLVYIDEALGGADLEAEFYFKNPQELEHALTEIKKKYSNVIREYEYLVYSKVLKYDYFPG